MDSKQKFVTDAPIVLRSSGATVEGADTSARARSAHSAALDEIWRSHAKYILRITQRITNNREDAEDALQDSFLRAYLHLHTFDGRSSIATWVTRIAINSALLTLRKRAGGSQVPIPQVSGHDDANSAIDVREAIPVDSSPSPEARYAELERRALVRSAIATLRPSIRQALELQTLEDRSVKETAKKMGISVSAAKSRIFQAKAALRKSLQPKVGSRAVQAKAFQLSPA